MKLLHNVNWVDGMKINKSHFLHTDKVRENRLQQLGKSLLKSYEYGLLSLENRTNSPVFLEDSFICLAYCSAITRQGFIVHIEDNSDLKFDLKTIVGTPLDQLDELIIALKADPYSRVPTGTPNVEELPPRQPFATPTYELTLVDPAQITSDEFANSFIILSKLISKDGIYHIDETYIPPCQQINSHTELLLRYQRIETHINNIGLAATQVVQKARSKKRRGEINDLAENTFYLMEKIVFFLAENMNEIRTLYKEESPVFIITFLNSFGRLVLTALRCLKNVDREALLRYYESHLGMKAHQFEADFKMLSQIEYNHLNLKEIFDQMDHHIGGFATVVKKAIELEYHSVERVDVIQETSVKKNKLDIF